ncbi:pilus assembly protein [Methylovulum psychrotolerans]|uniref:Type IV pilus biogenesis factor PilY1 n=1 Tax=Methylovulum psychrotolerans TaxID=1704499 RepID=A0A2S5CJ77_9GAMM|nr:PilC/PilY family type IV pilus protein [Methylovulum psychrotolerans]POZ50865.1 Type IV pilus biogenesis factor PilY1 [Methylovulum psychrotolerans]
MNNTIKIQLRLCGYWLRYPVAVCALLFAAVSFAGQVAQSPLFLTNAAKPIVMLNMSRDHQLYFKAFDDYSDIDGNGIPDTTYMNNFDYYGYFDSSKCYTYSNNEFEPSATAQTSRYCPAGNSLWSGNFLNWATMTRMDEIRKILYGGLRSTDSGTVTVLERAFIPNDGHSFAKYYVGVDSTELTKLTPYTAAQVTNGITLCNTTATAGSVLSQNSVDPPKVRVVKGDYRLWAANERWQCTWSGEHSASNSNNSTYSGMASAGSSPSATDAVVLGDYIARILVCVSGNVGNETCKTYPNGNVKPIGLLQTYGDDNLIRFGLMTGSYSKNKSGGVLRKNVGTMADEINVTTDGAFKVAPSGATTSYGIISTINRLRTYGYSYNDGTYNSGDNCNWGLNTFINGNCTNWGNPQSEILLESLRYIAGKTAYTTFSANDTTKIPGLTTAAFSDPISSTEWCASLNIIQFNASVSSYDNDDFNSTNLADIAISDLNAETNTVGSSEGITNNNYFIGENGTDNNQLCTAKTLTSLSAARGVCPEAPRLSGTYLSSGLAHFSHINDMRPAMTGNQLINFYGVALAPAIPKWQIPIPGTDKFITLLPACQNTGITAGGTGNCALMDFKVVSQTSTGTSNSGKLYVNWEDSEQGGDFDQDMWGTIEYTVTSSQVIIKTGVIAQSTSFPMAFGYVINGTTQDGFHAHSGIYSYKYTDPTGVTACNTCSISSPPAFTSVTYTIGTATNGQSLQQPLYYAAKWGGFVDAGGDKAITSPSEWDANQDGLPDRYYAATSPQKLATSLADAFADVLRTPASASSVATNSTQFQTDSFVYQATFNSTDWSGHLYAYTLVTEDTNGNGKLDLATPTSATEDTNGNGKLDAGGIGKAVWDAGQNSEDTNGNGVLDVGEDSNGNNTLDTSLIPAAAARRIYSYDPSKTGLRGIEFLWGGTSLTSLNDAQKTVLDNASFTAASTSSPIIDYLRGDRSKEIKLSPTGIYRTRTNLLGDIINSDPLFVGRDNQGYTALPGNEGSDYTAFTHQNRTAMLYVGSNDGMLHAVNATTGAEVFTYIPNAVISAEFASLVLPNYTHKYFVDGSPQYGDAYFDNIWHTILVGSMGAGSTTTVGGAAGTGGRAVFALDITNPDGFADIATGLGNILWEFSNRDDTDLGYTIPKASVVRMADGGWRAIVSNGFDSASGNAALFILDIKTGAVVKKIVLDSTGSNGLAAPVTVDADNDRIIDYIYAGDLKGNLWKIDVTSGSTSAWAVSNGGTPLFVAQDSVGNRQPITEKPAITQANGSGQNVGFMVYFGTGKYFETGDNLVSGSSPIQTFYGIWDNCSKASVGCSNAITGGRGALQQQSIIFEGPSNFTYKASDGSLQTVNIRVVSNCDVAYDGTTPSTTGSPCTANVNRRGWYMDLLQPSLAAQGEMSYTEPQVRNGLVIFATSIPINETCTPGGTGWLMELDASSGARLSGSAFDVNGDGKIDASDLSTLSGDQVADSGMQSTVGIIKTPTIVACEATMDCKYMSGSNGALMVVHEANSGPGCIPTASDPCSNSTGNASGLKRLLWKQW